jgi:cytosine/adenosine deaminase-related metal-dependent hydrolase
VLGRDDVGALAPGMAADVATFPLDEIGMAGAQHDPLAALVFCSVPRAANVVVNGRAVVRDGRLATLDLPLLVERHNRLSAELLAAPRG